MIASSAGHVEMVEALISRGAEVNATNHNGQSCLHYAASRDRLDVARVLLDKGAEVNARDKMGSCPLHRAASRGHVKMVQLLLSRPSIQLNPADSIGNTPL